MHSNVVITLSSNLWKTIYFLIFCLKAICYSLFWTDAISTISNHINLGSYLKQWGSQKDIFTVGEKIHYGCEEGFALQGNFFNRTCLKNGSWSGEAPTCNFYECSDQIDSGKYHFKIRDHLSITSAWFGTFSDK